MNIETFQNLSQKQVAQIVRTSGPKVCVFPINGTRRWFMLEYPDQAATNFAASYMEITWQRQVELYRLLFDHGIDTLLNPIFGPDLLERGEKYRQLVLPGLLWCAQNPEILEFYDAYDVRVHVYGDTRRYLQDTPYACALDAFDEIAQHTASHRQHRLFFGVCAHDASETIAQIGAQYYQEHGCLPTRRQIVSAYYGEYVEPVDLFIGFDRLAAFDMPLLATGDQDLYFMASPSPYLDAHTLRAILYDHLYTRRVDESSYTKLQPKDWSWMRAFYRANQSSVLGIGTKRGGIWYPLAQIASPDDEQDHVSVEYSGGRPSS